MDIQRTETMPKLLRIIMEKRSHALPAVMTINSKLQKVFIPAGIITAHTDQEEISEEKVIPQERTFVEITEDIKADDFIATAIETSGVGARKDVADEDRVPKDVRDETKIHDRCPQKNPEGISQKPILCKCGLPFDPRARPCSIVKRVREHVPCAQKKSEEEPRTCGELAFKSNNYACPKYNNITDDCLRKDNRFERKEIYCARCRLSTMQCICNASYLDCCSKADKPKFRDVSPLKIGSLYTNSCKAREEVEYGEMVYCHSNKKFCRCKCLTHGDHSRINDKRK